MISFSSENHSEKHVFDFDISHFFLLYFLRITEILRFESVLEVLREKRRGGGFSDQRNAKNSYLLVGK